MIVSLSVVNFNDEPSISKLKLTPTAAVRNAKTKNAPASTRPSPRQRLRPQFSVLNLVSSPPSCYRPNYNQALRFSRKIGLIKPF